MMARPVRIARRSKYNITRERVDGLTFDSPAEARRWSELRLLVRAGQISGLQRQVAYDLYVWPANGVDTPLQPPAVVGRYVADFCYRDADGHLVCEDVKGIRTPLYRWKKRHFEAQYGRPIIEITTPRARRGRRAPRARAARVSRGARS